VIENGHIALAGEAINPLIATTNSVAASFGKEEAFDVPERLRDAEHRLWGADELPDVLSAAEEERAAAIAGARKARCSASCSACRRAHGAGAGGRSPVSERFRMTGRGAAMAAWEHVEAPLLGFAESCGASPRAWPRARGRRR
jgi:hypothetical protein